MRIFFLLVVWLGVTLSPASVAAATKTRVWPCYWIHGRMIAGNGTPSIRIWPRNTHRLLGVVNLEHPIADDEYAPEIPANAENLLTPENDYTVWGDFYVCPVAPERAGWMRFVVVRKARKLIVGHDRSRTHLHP